MLKTIVLFPSAFLSPSLLELSLLPIRVVRVPRCHRNPQVSSVELLTIVSEETESFERHGNVETKNDDGRSGF